MATGWLRRARCGRIPRDGVLADVAASHTPDRHFSVENDDATISHKSSVTNGLAIVPPFHREDNRSATFC